MKSTTANKILAKKRDQWVIEDSTSYQTKDLALQDFTILRQLGFHQSAYKLLFESYKYQEIKGNKDSLVKTLMHNEKFIYSWFQNNTK